MYLKRFYIKLFLLVIILGSCASDTSRPFKEILIGQQVWMVENLSVDRFRNGDLIMRAKTLVEWKLAIKDKRPAWCYYNDDEDKYRKGKLYNWYAVNDPRKLAPSGWHIPNREEFTALIDTLGGDSIAGKKMKSKKGWDEPGNGTNESGFSALAGGFRHVDGDFADGGSWAGNWWTSTEVDSSDAILVNLNYRSDGAMITQFEKGSGFSVRCIKD